MENKEVQRKLFREIPAVNDLMQEKAIQQLIAQNGEHEIKKVIHQVLDEIRQQILSGKLTAVNLSNVIEMINTQSHLDNLPSLRPVINGTGVILHTNLGRSLLSPAI